MYLYLSTMSSFVNLTASIICVSVWLLWAKRHKRHWPYAVPPITWALHVIIFYSVVIWGGNELTVDRLQLMRIWSSAVRLHAIFLVVGIGVVMLVEKIRVNNNGGQ